MMTTIGSPLNNRDTENLHPSCRVFGVELSEDEG